MSDKDQPLKVEMQGETLSITIGISALSAAVLRRYDQARVEKGKIKVVDDYALACAAIVEMRKRYGEETPVSAWLGSTAQHGAVACNLIQAEAPEPSSGEA